jgi:hypothetical protein
MPCNENAKNDGHSSEFETDADQTGRMALQGKITEVVPKISSIDGDIENGSGLDENNFQK